MDPAAGGEGEVLCACQLGDRDEVMRDDASGYNSPAGGGSYGDVGRDGTRSSGRPVRKRTKPAQGTQQRPPKGAAAAEDSRAGWSRGDLTGGSSDSHPEDRLASPRRERSDLLRERATLDVQTAQALAGRLRQELNQARQDALRYNQERNEARAELVALHTQQSAAAVRSALAPIFQLSAE
jgi:hypothetical protein